MAVVTLRQTVLLRSRQLTAPVDVQHHWMIQTTPAIDQTTIFYLHLDAALLAENQKMLILKSLVLPDQESNP
jgi:hypothetical protein